MLDHKTKSCVPCGLHQPVRNAYFDGRLLDGRAFIAEQDYNRGHRNMHNALLHGSGTVCGLKLIQHPLPNCRREYLVIEPGLALDCCGQEIVVPERTLVPIAEMLAADSDLADALEGGKKHLFVAIRRCDCGAEPMPLILPGCEGENGASAYSRTAEGFKFTLSARAPAEVTPLETPVNPKLNWVHTITLGAQTPIAVHFNDGEDLVQIAARNNAGGSHVYLHHAENHDLVSLLEGPETISETQSSRAARLIFAAGEDFDIGGSAISGVGIWKATGVQDNASPEAVIPTTGRLSRVAVSPTTGAVFVLEFVDGSNARLVAYSAESVNAWLASTPAAGSSPVELASLDFDHGFGNKTHSPQRGAAMMVFSHDGKYLAIAAPTGQAQKRLYLIDVAAFNTGGMTLDDARAEGYSSAVNERLAAVAWGQDDKVLYLLSTRPAGGGSIFVTRHVLTGTGNQIEHRGQGVELAGKPLDLAVAPTERHAYVLLEDPDGKTRLTAVNVEVVKALGSTTPVLVELSDDALHIDGTGRSMALKPNGALMYVSAADAAPSEAPERGLVAVIKIAEDNCGAHFDAAINDCPACKDGGDYAVVLGHLPNYDAAETPRMMDQDEASAGDVAIDNLTYRPLVPSTATIHKVVECILAQGVAEGPPGPRGDPGSDGADGTNGTDGTDGLSIDTVNVAMTAPGTTPTGETVPDAGALTLNLTIPAAADGSDGSDGDGIDDATIEYLSTITDPQVQIVTQAGQRILDIDLPEPEGGAGLPPVNPIIAVSWKHGEVFVPQSGDLIEELAERGLAVAFENKVAWPQFTGSRRAGPSMLVELQTRVGSGSGLFHWASLANLVVNPIKVTQISGTLLENWNVLNSAQTTQGFAVRLRVQDGDLPDIKPGEILRLVFYADFVVDVDKRPVDGSHLGGQLPTGRDAPGDTFRSWFTLGPIG